MTPRQGTILQTWGIFNDGVEDKSCNVFMVALLIDRSVWQMTDTDKTWKKIS